MKPIGTKKVKEFDFPLHSKAAEKAAAAREIVEETTPEPVIDFTREDLYRVPALGWCGPRYSEALALEAQGYLFSDIATGYRARLPNSHALTPRIKT